MNETLPMIKSKSMALGSRGIDSFQDSISSYTKGVRSALAFNQEIELTQEYIAKQPYSFIRVDLGRGANIVMVLMQAENNFFTWVSATGEKIITYNGKIIKTSGLTHNVEIINPTEFKVFSESNIYSGTFDVMLRNPQAFIEQEFTISIIKDEPETLLIEEKINVGILNSAYSNFYWMDKKFGKVIKSKQTINPKLPSLRIDFIYKY